MAAGEPPDERVERLNLLGVPCPINWARAKATLARMQVGERLELLTDDPRAIRDIPAAAEAEGYLVLAAERVPEGIRILIER